MLLSISLILLVGMSVGWICKKMRLPSLLGMLVTGMVLGPYMLDLLDGSILGISAELRKIALIIILTRLSLIHIYQPHGYAFERYSQERHHEIRRYGDRRLPRPRVSRRHGDVYKRQE